MAPVGNISLRVESSEADQRFDSIADFFCSDFSSSIFEIVQRLGDDQRHLSPLRAGKRANQLVNLRISNGRQIPSPGSHPAATLRLFPARLPNTGTKYCPV